VTRLRFRMFSSISEWYRHSYPVEPDISAETVTTMAFQSPETGGSGGIRRPPNDRTDRRSDHPHLGDEEGTGQRISRGVNVLLGRGDEEPNEVVPAEGAGGRLGSTDLDEAVESPVRAVAVDGTAVGHRGPYAPLGIDGEPIGQAALGQFDEDAAVAQPVGGVEAEDGDLPCGRVVVVDERPVGA